MKTSKPAAELASTPSLSPSSEAEHKGAFTCNVSPSTQVANLLSVDEDYAARYDRCIKDVASFTSVKQLVEKGQKGVGYVGEHNSFRGMPGRSIKYGLPMDVELLDFRWFLLHIGPKPHYETNNRLSIERIDNLKGYRVGNIEWADALQQAFNRRSTRHHQVEGAYLSDGELARLLSAQSGRPVTKEAVKKRRARGMSTEEQFARSGVPYLSGLSPKQNWRFPPDAPWLASTYKTSRRRNETRLDFYVRMLREKLRSLSTKIASSKFEDEDQRRRAVEQVAAYKLKLQPMEALLKQFDEQEFEDDLVPIVALSLPLPPAHRTPVDLADSKKPENQHVDDAGKAAATFQALKVEFDAALTRRGSKGHSAAVMPRSEVVAAIAGLDSEIQMAMIALARYWLEASENMAFFAAAAQTG